MQSPLILRKVLIRYAHSEAIGSTHRESDLRFMSQKILVAEDQQHIRSLIEYKLKNSGYTVVCAEDGRTALEKAGEILPDLILLDVMMPLMTGFEVLAALKENEKTRNIPILMVTAQSKEDEVLKGLELGADDYITKPFSPNELAARVKTVLLRRRNIR
jgi:DNA-binding response OmpR family regulator